MAGGIIFLLAIWGAVIAWSVNVARKRGREAAAWGIVAVFIGVFAVIVLYLLPSRKEA